MTNSLKNRILKPVFPAGFFYEMKSAEQFCETSSFLFAKQI